MTTPSNQLTPTEIRNLIYHIRGKAVMLDSDLANLYQVPTFRLNEAVKRNSKRFPDDFMFQLTQDEFKNLISQIAISSSHGGRATRVGGAYHCSAKQLLPTVFLY